MTAVTVIRFKCPACGDKDANANVEADTAAHDSKLLDVIVECCECGAKFNEFLTFSEMVRL